MSKILSYRGLAPMLLAVTAVLAGCSSMPRQNATLEDARTEYQQARNTPVVTELASAELNDAGLALDKANAAAAAHDGDERVTQLAYVAKQKIATSQEVAKRKQAEATVAATAQQRDQLLLTRRTNEADQAKQQAQDARMQAQDAQARNAQLRAMLSDLQAKQTERGMVITLGDVLFDVDQARLTPEGMRSVQKLADFMQQDQQRTVMIEGYTDSTGSSAHNLDLSNRRANAVRSALESMGIGRERINTRGYGEARPVAANDSAAHRQLNRRVEVVLSDDKGQISSR